MSELPTTDPSKTVNKNSDVPRDVMAVVVQWNVDSPGRSGEVFLIPADVPGPFVIGRSLSDTEHGRALEPVRQRPGINQSAGALDNPSISRRQLKILPIPGGLQIENIGRTNLIHKGKRVREPIRVRPGGVMILQSTLVLRVETRPERLPYTPSFPRKLWPKAFGGPDALGLVGESPRMWALRGQLGLTAGRSAHVLIHGESGTGKELAAQAIHKLSKRSGSALVSRNAATIPSGLISAELFGNTRNYPNPGMEARPGMIGEAHNSSLLLDEIGEISQEAQAQLLRVLDSGEYSRLGDSRPRHADFRLIAATNRSPQHLKPDLRARLSLMLRMPSLNERLSDIGQLLRHLIALECRDDPDFGIDICDERGEPRISSTFIARLSTYSFRLNIRELRQLMLTSFLTSSSDRLKLTADVQAELAGTVDPAPVAAVRPRDLDPIYVQEILDKYNGEQEKAWREVGLTSRYAMYRYVKRHNLRVRKRNE